MSTYPNQFARIGIPDAAVLSRLSDCFSTIFFSPENNFYHQHPTDPDAACMVDTGNNDARTEGMSYGMMMCVQMNRKDLFDKLWTFSMRYMHLSSGVHQGYFAWSVQLDGKHNAEGPAPDGEEYFAMALLMASARWGDGEGFSHIGTGRRIFCATACIKRRWSRAVSRCGIRKITISSSCRGWKSATRRIICRTSITCSRNSATSVTMPSGQRRKRHPGGISRCVRTR